MALIIRFPPFLLYFIGLVLAVDKNNFKTCDQSSFCRRLRGVTPDNSKYEVEYDSLQIADNFVEAKLVNTEGGAQFKFLLTAIAGNIFRLQVDEVNPLHPRYRPQYALKAEPQVAKLEVLDRNKDSVVVQAIFRNLLILLTQYYNCYKLTFLPLKFYFRNAKTVLTLFSADFGIRLIMILGKALDIHGTEHALKEISLMLSALSEVILTSDG